jgi:hypothetical protein
MVDVPEELPELVFDGVELPDFLGLGFDGAVFVSEDDCGTPLERRLMMVRLFFFLLVEVLFSD